MRSQTVQYIVLKKYTVLQKNTVSYLKLQTAVANIAPLISFLYGLMTATIHGQNTSCFLTSNNIHCVDVSLVCLLFHLTRHLIIQAFLSITRVSHSTHLARSRNSDSARPALVQMTQLVRQLLHTVCFHTGSVMCNNIVCQGHCTLKKQHKLIFKSLTMTPILKTMAVCYCYKSIPL